MLKISVLFFAAALLTLALGISGEAGVVSFETGRRAFFLGLSASMATFFGALLTP